MIKKGFNRVDLLGCPIDAISMKETIEIIDDAIKNKSQLQHVVINGAKFVNMRKDIALKNAILDCDIVNADGQSIVSAARLLNIYIPERVAGIDLMSELVNLSSIKGYKVFFLGAKEEIVSKVVDIYTKKYSKSVIAGYHNGYFSETEEIEVAKKIENSKADILFVAITSPKKEIFLNKYKNEINIPFVMGVGGSFDVVSGFTKRAPLWLQKIGMEWSYRVFQEPKRMWKRYLTTNSIFIYLILKQKIKIMLTKDIA